MLRNRCLLLNAAEDPANPGAAGGGGDNPKASLMDRIKAATQSKDGLQAKLTLAETKVTDLETQVKDLTGKLSAAEGKVTKLEADAAEVEKALAAAEKETADLTAKEQDLATRASEAAKVIIRGVGIDPTKLPAAGGAATNTYEKALEQWGKLKDPKERATFYASTIMPLLNAGSN